MGYRNFNTTQNVYYSDEIQFCEESPIFKYVKNCEEFAYISSAPSSLHKSRSLMSLYDMKLWFTSDPNV